MSFNIGLSGLRAATSDLNVTGNNIANAGTIGFKQSRAEFADVYAATVLGTGKNQQGSGVLLASVSQLFNQGNINHTQNPLDLAINGNGFFQVSNNGALSYTRAGIFGTDQEGFIVDNFGYNLQGYVVDQNDQIMEGVVGNLQIKSTSQDPRATSSMRQSFNLNSTMNTPANGTFNPSDPASYNSSTSTNIYDGQGNAHTFTQYFVKTGPNSWDMQVLIDGAHPHASAANFAAQNAATAQDAFDDAITALNAAGAGDLVNNLMADAGLTIEDPVNPPARILDPSLNIDQVRAGISRVGNNSPVTVGLAFDTAGKLQQQNVTAPYFTTNTDGTINLAQWTPGLLDGSKPPILIDNGALMSPTGMMLDMRSASQYASAFAVTSVSQDGYTTGELSGVEIDDTGLIFARYTNGQSKVQGQVILADFANPQGLKPVGKTQWVQSLESGEPVRNPGRTGTLGAIEAGALEDSNVELSDQLVNLIIAQRNYQANAKTIETNSAITQTIINLR